MSTTINKVLTIFLYILLAVSVVFMIWLYTGIVDIPVDATFAQVVDTIDEPLNYAMRWTYILLGGAAVFAILFGLVNMFSSVKNAIKSVAAIIIFGLFVFLAYSLASDAPLQLSGSEVMEDAKTLVYSGAGLITMYIFFGLAVLAIIATEVISIFR
jgi:hypothetical protein